MNARVRPLLADCLVAVCPLRIRLLALQAALTALTGKHVPSLRTRLRTEQDGSDDVRRENQEFDGEPPG